MEGERKQVTVLFADVQGSMDLQEEVDPEEWHGIMNGFFEVLTEGVHRFEGTVNQYTGDGIMALFGAPIAHEDHAQRACYAALQIREGLAEYATGLRRTKGLNFIVRLGINSGDVVVGAIGDDLRMDYTAQGHTVGLASRMESLAGSGEINLSDDTAKLVAPYFVLDDLGPHNVKGVSEPMHVWRLRTTGRARTRLEASEARGFSQFVGRERELGILQDAWQRTCEGGGGVVGIVAEAGMGKSRLCHEFTERCRAEDVPAEFRVMRGVSHGASVPLLAMLGYLREVCGIEEGDTLEVAQRKVYAGHHHAGLSLEREELDFLLDFMGFPNPAQPVPHMEPEVRQRRISHILTRVSEQRARLRPMLIIVEDLHWFDPLSERDIAAMVQNAPDMRLLVVATFRPEYHAPWMEHSSYQQIALPPIRDETGDAFFRALLGSDASLNGLSRIIQDQSGGNPFFAEEAVQALVEDGALAGVRGAYVLTKDIKSLVVPATVQSVLAARIDRLAESEKALLQNAAVIGRRCAESVLLAVSDLSAEAGRTAIEGLLRAELLYEAAIYPEREFSFKHALTQDVAYDLQLREHRKAVHARVAEQLRESHDENVDEHAALIAHHYEEAGQREDAAAFHARAGDWIGARDPAEAFRHWRSVVELLGEQLESSAHRALFVDAVIHIINSAWRTALTDVEPKMLFARAWDMTADETERERRFLLLERYTTFCIVMGDNDEATRRIDLALEMADGLGREEQVIARINPTLIQFGDRQRCADYAGQAVAIAGDDDTLGVAALGYYPVLFHRMTLADYYLWAGRPQLAVEEQERVFARADELGDGEVGCWSRSFAVYALAILGRADAAKRLMDASVAQAEDSGSLTSLHWAHQFRAWMHVCLLEWEEAHATFAHVLDYRSRSGVQGFNPIGYVGKALAALCLGRDEEAGVELAEYLASREGRDPDLWDCAALLIQAALECRRTGTPREAKSLIDEAAAAYTKLGLGLGETIVALTRAYVAVRCGAAHEAERHFELALMQLRKMHAYEQVERIRAAFGPLLERVA